MNLYSAEKLSSPARHNGASSPGANTYMPVVSNPHVGSGSAQFHLVASTFATTVNVSQVCGYFIPVSVMEEVVRRYSAKESQAAIAADLGLRRAVVRRILVERGVTLRVRSPTSEEHRQAVLKMHAGGKRIKEISSELGLDFTTVYRILRRAGRVKKKRTL